MKSILILGSVLFFSIFEASVQAEVLSISIEPVIGYERVQKVRPTAHFSDRLTYGARIRAGIPLVSGEGEYLRAQDTESFPSLGLTTKDTDDKVKLGLRSSHSLTSLISIWGRGGGQAKRNTHDETVGAVTTRTVGSWVFKPYAGVGLNSRIFRNFELDGGITVIFNDFPRMASNEYETTLGFVVRFP